MKLLALEASTTSAKAMLYDPKSGQSRVLTQEYGKLNKESVRMADVMLEKTLAVGRRLAAGEEIGAISLGVTWHSLMLCDREMRPVTPPCLWNHMGAAEICREIRKKEEEVERFYRKTGCMVHAMYPAFKVEYFREQGLPVETSYLVNMGTYFTWMLTGKRISTLCLASGSGFLNLVSGSYDEKILKEYGIEKWQMSPLVQEGEILRLSKEAAKLLGIEEGVPVIPAEADGGLNQIGAGASGYGWATLSVGTSSAIRVSVKNPVLSGTRDFWCYRSPAGYLAGAAANGCNCTDWAREQLFQNSLSYSEIEKRAERKEDGPIFMPFLFGERCPGWQDKRRASFSGFLSEHTAYDLYRAVQEGVIFNIYQCYRALMEAGVKVEKIMLSGGILRSELWTQMCADIFQRELYLSNVTEQASLIGGIVLAMKEVGMIEKPEDFKAKITGVIRPDKDSRLFYERKYIKYLEAYGKDMGKE